VGGAGGGGLRMEWAGFVLADGWVGMTAFSRASSLNDFLPPLPGLIRIGWIRGFRPLGRAPPPANFWLALWANVSGML